MAKKITKADEKILIELSHMFRHEALPPFSDGLVSCLPNDSAKKRRKNIQANLEQSFNNGVSEINKAMGNLMAAGITLLQQGLKFEGQKAVWNVLLAKGCCDGFIRKVLKLIEKTPKLVLEVCWPSAELMSSKIISTWKPGWNDFNINPNYFKFPARSISDRGNV